MNLKDILNDILSLVTQLSLTLIIGYALNISVGIDVHSKYAIIMYIFLLILWRNHYSNLFFNLKIFQYICILK